MYLTAERIQRILKELKDLIYPNRYVLENVVKKDGYYKNPEKANSTEVPYEPFSTMQLWEEKDGYAWFKASFEVPEKLDGKPLVFMLETGNQGFDATNPQFMVYINKELKQGFDVNHKITNVTGSAKVGDIYTFEMQAYSGLSAFDSVVAPPRCIMSVCELDRNTEKLFYDLSVPYEAAMLMREQDNSRIMILKHLEKAINILDLRKPSSECYTNSVEQALDYMESEFYSKECGVHDVVASCVGHTHIDVAWLWDLAQTREKVQRTFATVLEHMSEYPEYIFMSSQPQLYQFLKEENPNLYSRVKQAVKEGRWEAEGAMWLEADCNISSGESLVRQIMLGKRFFRDEFGCDNKILWLPDVFGYSSALPQILKKSGVDYFMTTKISWNEYNKLPFDTFKWVGLDGSEVLTHFITAADYKSIVNTHGTTYNGRIDASQVMGSWERYQQKNLNSEVLISFGYGDGGGGPTKEMLEAHERFKRGIPGCPTTKIDTALNFFERLDANTKDNPKLPRWVGELYLEYHRGTLTTMARNKRYNRKSEFLYEEIETLCVAQSILAQKPYPQKEIDKGWEIICLNQFHDIIPGSSIKKVYEDSKEQYETIIKSGEEIKNSALKGIAANIKSDEPSVVVFNPAPFVRDELVEVETDSGLYSFIAKALPAKGYKKFALSEVTDEGGCLYAGEKGIENEFVKVKFDGDYNIVSVYDKKAMRELVKPGQRANVLQAFEDKPYRWDAWDINIFYQEKMWEITSVESFETIECSNNRAAVKVIRKFLDSTITQEISITAASPKIDFKTEIDWKEKQILLKALFPVDIHTEKATYDIQFGNVERPTHWNTSWDMAKFEVCAHKWADISEGGYGVSLLNDCKYGYDIKESNMRLTLLKSPITPNEDADREMHYFTYSLYPHTGDWKSADTVKLGYELNQPVSCVLIDVQEGVLPGEMSFVSVDKDNVVIEVVKKAQDNDDVIIRIHECKNKREYVTVSFFKDIKKVTECDLEERQDLCNVKSSGGDFEFEIKPYEIKTFRLKL